MGVEQLNNLIGKWVSGFSINVITDRTLIELASILTPSIILILVLFGVAVSLENKTWRSFNLWICLLITIFYLPYELIANLITSLRLRAMLMRFKRT